MGYTQRRHMAALASLSGLGIAVWTFQPLTEGIVDQCVPEDSKVAGRAELTLGLEWRVCVFAGSHIIKRTSEELVIVRRAAKLE
jgi:hypothetical protein